MSVRFIVGRAGTGKTHHCLASIREQLIAEPLTGPRLVLLVPEQASMQMERALLAGELRATARAEVLSFRRLALRILEASPAAKRTALSPVARAMVLRGIIAERAGSLRYYRHIERMPGFLEGLGRTISELIEEGVAPDDLRAAVLPQDADESGAKLADLAEIYAAYLSVSGGNATRCVAVFAACAGAARSVWRSRWRACLGGWFRGADRPGSGFALRPCISRRTA
jgi:ATP-dependent helicase/nuclease subunit B